MIFCRSTARLIACRTRASRQGTSSFVLNWITRGAEKSPFSTSIDSSFSSVSATSALSVAPSTSPERRPATRDCSSVRILRVTSLMQGVPGFQ